MHTSLRKPPSKRDNIRKISKGVIFGLSATVLTRLSTVVCKYAMHSAKKALTCLRIRLRIVLISRFRECCFAFWGMNQRKAYSISNEFTAKASSDWLDPKQSKFLHHISDPHYATASRMLPPFHGPFTGPGTLTVCCRTEGGGGDNLPNGSLIRPAAVPPQYHL